MLTPHDPYVEQCETRVADREHDPLFNGVHLTDIITYLSQATRQPASGTYSADDGPFLWLYTCLIDKLRPSSFRGIRCFQSASHGAREPKLMFLSGHPSPGWLNAIGLQYNVSEQFFQRHLNSFSSGRSISYAEPTLPSRSHQILKLTIPTIGHITPPAQPKDNAAMEMQNIRQECMAWVRESLQKNRETGVVASSIVRGLHIHDWKDFTLEQEISMCVLWDQSVSWKVLVWTDAAGIEKNPELPLKGLPVFKEHDYKFELHPTILDRTDTKIDLAGDGFASCASSTALPPPQTLRLLHRFYGTSLDYRTLSLEPFYALHEIYSFSAAAEIQFLNMMENLSSERQELATLKSSDHVESLTFDLHFDRNILDAHHERLRSIVKFLDSGPQDEPLWFPGGLEEQNKVAKQARLQLLKDFQHLQHKAEILIKRTERIIDMVTHNASILEARRSFLQAEGLSQLSRLTAVITILYVPSSFVCSFFGMNFKQLGSGERPLWIWAAVSIPVVCISMLVFWNQLNSSKASKPAGRVGSKA